MVLGESVKWSGKAEMGCTGAGDRCCSSSASCLHLRDSPSRRLSMLGFVCKFKAKNLENMDSVFRDQQHSLKGQIEEKELRKGTKVATDLSLSEGIWIGVRPQRLSRN